MNEHAKRYYIKNYTKRKEISVFVLKSVIPEDWQKEHMITIMTKIKEYSKNIKYIDEEPVIPVLHMPYKED